jgi:hypothetical protein
LLLVSSVILYSFSTGSVFNACAIAASSPEYGFCSDLAPSVTEKAFSLGFLYLGGGPVYRESRNQCHPSVSFFVSGALKPRPASTYSEYPRNNNNPAVITYLPYSTKKLRHAFPWYGPVRL